MGQRKMSVIDKLMDLAALPIHTSRSAADITSTQPSVSQPIKLSYFSFHLMVVNVSVWAQWFPSKVLRQVTSGPFHDMAIIVRYTIIKTRWNTGLWLTCEKRSRPITLSILLAFSNLLQCQGIVPTRTGKPGKMGKLFPVRELCTDWKSQGNLDKILEKSGKFRQFLGFFCVIFNWTAFVKMYQVFSFQAHLVGVLSGYPIWGKLMSHSLYL